MACGALDTHTRGSEAAVQGDDDNSFEFVAASKSILKLAYFTPLSNLKSEK